MDLIFYGFCYFSQVGEIRHDDRGFLLAPHLGFCLDRGISAIFGFLSFGLIGFDLLNISFADRYQVFNIRSAPPSLE